MSSYFEIGGHIVECSADDNTSLPSSISMVSVAERPERGRNSAKYETSPMSITSPSSGGKGESVYERTSRLRRARRALSIAAAIALADGPLPIGDAIAVVGLGAYAVYEINYAAGDPLKMSEGPYRWR